MEVVISIIVSIISLFVSILAYVQTLKNNKFTKKLEIERRQDELEKKHKELINNRPQFEVVSYRKNLDNPGYVKDDTFNFDVLFLPYKSLSCDMDNYSELYQRDRKTGEQDFIKNGRKNEPKKPICEYKDIYNKKEEWVSFEFELENIGKSNLQFHYLLNAMEKTGSLVNLKDRRYYKVLIDSKGCEHSVTSTKNDVKIGERIKIKINFHKDYIVTNTFSTSFLINMKTEDGECWQQGIFLDNHEKNQSHKISNKEFSDYYQGYYLDAVMYDRAYWGIVNSKRCKR